MDKNHPLSVRKQCQILGLNRSSLYIRPNGETDLNLELMRAIDEHHLKHPTKGVKQMQDFLKSKGYAVNEKRIRRLMRKMNIEAIYPKRNLSEMGLLQYKHSYLLRNMAPETPNQFWAIDISYISMKKGLNSAFYRADFLDFMK